MRRLPWVLLALSLGLNAALLLRGRAGDGPVGAADARAPRDSLLSPARAPDLHPPSPVPRGAPGPAALPPAGLLPRPEAASAAALEAEVARLQTEQTELVRRLPLHERFERGTGGPEAEARIRPDLERALKAAGARGWSLACRGSICRLELLSPDEVSWQQPFQTDPDLQRWVRGMQFTAGTYKTDPVSGETYVENEVHLEIREALDLVSPELSRLVQAFKVSSALSDCTRGHAEKGSWQARVDLGALGISVMSAGSLSTRAAGRCLEERLRAALARFAGGTGAEPGCTDCGAVAFVELVSPPVP